MSHNNLVHLVMVGLPCADKSVNFTPSDSRNTMTYMFRVVLINRVFFPKTVQLIIPNRHFLFKKCGFSMEGSILNQEPVCHTLSDFRNFFFDKQIFRFFVCLSFSNFPFHRSSCCFIGSTPHSYRINHTFSKLVV